MIESVDLHVEVRDQDIVVTVPGTLILRRRTQTDDHELLAQTWEAANDKARELGWIA
jgi:hypothetical protein